jgi:hypothetical protein
MTELYDWYGDPGKPRSGKKKSNKTKKSKAKGTVPYMTNPAYSGVGVGDAGPSGGGVSAGGDGGAGGAGGVGESLAQDDDLLNEAGDVVKMAFKLVDMAPDVAKKAAVNLLQRLGYSKIEKMRKEREIMSKHSAADIALYMTKLCLDREGRVTTVRGKVDEHNEDIIEMDKREEKLYELWPWLVRGAAMAAPAIVSAVGSGLKGAASLAGSAAAAGAGAVADVATDMGDEVVNQFSDDSDENGGQTNETEDDGFLPKRNYEYELTNARTKDEVRSIYMRTVNQLDSKEEEKKLRQLCRDRLMDLKVTEGIMTDLRAKLGAYRRDMKESTDHMIGQWVAKKKEEGIRPSEWKTLGTFYFYKGDTYEGKLADIAEKYDLDKSEIFMYNIENGPDEGVIEDGVMDKINGAKGMRPQHRRPDNRPVMPRQ